MKIKIDIKSAAEIEKIRTLIEAARQFEDSLIEGLSRDMGLKTEAQREILWDYIYNDSHWMVELEQNEKEI